jgi:hypothetical protein
MFNRLFWMSVLGLLSGLLLTSPPLAEERSVTSAPPQGSSIVKKATDSNRQNESHRRKRGGPASDPADKTNATPAEGQNDLIKVLQPVPLKKNNQ